MNNFYRVGLWNANGLVNHNQELKMFLNIHKIDIMLISETHFTDMSYFKIPSFSLYQCNHPDNTAHGGSAILIKNNVKHYELPPYSFDHIQASSIVVEDWSGPLTISAVYTPPRHNISHDQYKDFFDTLGGKFLVGGDFNAKHTMWGSRLCNPRGRSLLKTINDNNFQYVSTGEPSYWPTDPAKVPDLLDFFVTKGIPQTYIQVDSCLDLSSDHSPVIATLSSSAILVDRPLRLSSNLTDWFVFRELVNNSLSLNVPLKTHDEIEEAVELFNNTIQKCAFQATPNPKTGTCINQMNYPVHIKKQIAEKRRLRRIWHNTRNPRDKNAFNRAAQDLKRLLIKFNNERFQHFTSNLTPSEDTNYSLWKITRSFNRPRRPIPPLMLSNGSWAKDNKEKAEAFAEHLCKVFKPNDAPRPQNPEIQQILESPTQLSLPIKPFTPSEISKFIKSEIKSFKAPGYELITGQILKELPRKGIVFLTLIFNSILRTEYFPAQWKVSEIVMVAKPGKPPHLLGSYRPISLLPITSKIFEKLFLRRLQGIVDECDLIPSEQFGFRKSHSTIEQVHRVVNIIKEDIENKRFCSAAFLDISQAFDKVWHEGLLYKLKLTIPHTYFNIIKSYLTERHFRVKYQDVYTKLHKIEAGVPQGSVLGPILYTLFTADIPVRDDVTIASFADDTALLASHENPIIASHLLQSELDELSEWLINWRVKVNENKSTHVTFTTRHDTCPPVSLNNVLIPQSDEVKYLGMHLDRKLIWRSHIWNKRQYLNLKCRKLSWLLNKKSKLSVKNKLLVYKVILKPIWTYGVQLWGTASNSNIEIIQRFQSKLLRNILQAPWYVSNKVLHEDTSIPTVREVITNFSKKYHEKLEVHPNHLAINLLDNSESVYRLKRNSIFDLAHRFDV